MSLFKRISDNIRANLNSLLDKAEDPVNMLDQYLRDMEDDIADAEGAVAKQLAVVRKFEMQYEEANSMAAKRQEQAAEALQKGREDLARKALQDKKLHNSKAEDYYSQFESSNATAVKLKSQLKRMKEEYEKLRVKRDTLVARAQAAKAQKGINGVVNGFARNNARRDFDRMEERVLQMEAEVDVAFDLLNHEPDLDEELAALGNEDIDRELDQLKDTLGLANPGNGESSGKET